MNENTYNKKYFFSEKGRACLARSREKHKNKRKEEDKLYRLENKELISAKNKTRYEKQKQDPIFIRKAYESRFLKTYGISLQEREEMWLRQDKKCAICLDPITIELQGRSFNANYACVDHDHKTGVVRGLLCSHCNRALGSLKDSVDRAQKLILYLGKNE